MASKNITTYQAPKPAKQVQYKPPAYNEKKYRAGVDTSYYDKAINTYTTEANKQRATQIGEAGQARDTALRQAYVQKVQNQNALNENLAVSGVRGGATESSNLRLQNNYGTAVNSAHTDYSNAVNQINQATDKNIADYRADMESRKEEYAQNVAQARWQAARDDARATWQANIDRQNALWQAAREDSLNQYNAANEYWNNYYLDYYSGYSMEGLDAQLKKARTALANEKNPLVRQRLQQEIRGIQNRRGVLANANAAK